MSEAPLLTPIGYDALIADHRLYVSPHFRHSAIIERGTPSVQHRPDGEWHTYSKQYRPKGSTPLTGNLEFALKYEGVNLAILDRLFRIPGVREQIMVMVWEKPTGRYARKAWFLYEFLTGEQLDLPDATGNYVDLLDPEIYLTGPSHDSRRHRVRNNLLGVPGFCPIVRRTDALQRLLDARLDEQAKAIVATYDQAIIARAARYLYIKETRSSYEIEREHPSQERMQRFVRVLERAHAAGPLTKQLLVDVDRAVLDERYASDNYRSMTVYVGESPYAGHEVVHHVAARPDNIDALMEGLLVCHARMTAACVPPVVRAALTSFGFVYIHPFEDGNGRVHRFLIHQVLAEAGFTPEGLVFPVSAVMLADHRGYDEALESVSKAITELTPYQLLPDGSLEVQGETAHLFRYWDGTRVAEYLFEVVQKTIQNDLARELRFLSGYDQAKRAAQNIVDIPDRRLDLLIKLVNQNGGALSRTKRAQFSELTDGELSRIEAAIAEAFADPSVVEDNSSPAT